MLLASSNTDLTLAPLEQAYPQLFLELFDRHAERGLADETGLRGVAEVPLARDGDDIPQLVQGHGCGTLLTKQLWLPIVTFVAINVWATIT
jgi:hypothetical protein